jgi:excisionase family DNA binding protein
MPLLAVPSTVVPDGELLTVQQVAARLKMNPETVRRWLREGKLRGYLLGGDRGGYRVAADDLEAFIRARGNEDARVLAVYADPALGPDAANLLKWFIDRKTPAPETGQNRLDRPAVIAAATDRGWSADKTERLLQLLVDAGYLYVHDGAFGVVQSSRL